MSSSFRKISQNSKSNLRFIFISLFAIIVISGCKKEKEDEPVLEDKITKTNLLVSFDASGNPIDPEFVEIASSINQLNRPNDVAFGTLRENEIWILNERTSNTGGSTLIITNPGEQNESMDYRVDGNAWHFMSLPTALAWSNNGNWFTSPGILDANHSGGTFTGPTLWSGDLDVYAKPSGGNGSHLDMLHGSPYAMGIESEKDNICWVFDGWNGHLVMYDFKNDHGPGNAYHDDGEVLRFTDVKLTRKAGVPSHMRFDENFEWLYIIESATGRVLRVKPSTASFNKSVPLINEKLSNHAEMLGAEVEVFVDQGLTTPCGIEIFNGIVYVTDFETGEIIAYDIESKKEIARVSTSGTGITGICYGYDHLWFVNRTENKLFRIDQ
jgi:hypothetical protein